MKRTSKQPTGSTADFQQLIHSLNQSLKREWDRAERLQAELHDIKASRAWRVFTWMRALKRWLCPARTIVKTTAFFTEEIANIPESASGEVSIIIPFRDQPGLLKNLLRSLRMTKYRRFEIVLVDNGSTCPHTLRLLARLKRHRRYQIVSASEPFNFARLCNLGARRAAGDYLLFLNNDIEVIEPHWLGQMLRLAALPDVGVVGADLAYPDGAIQHAGLFPADEGRWTHRYRGMSNHFGGDHDELKRARTVPAVTGACLLIARDLFESIGHFREDFPVTGNDVDLCCRIRDRGLRVAITPDARLIHFECLSRGYTRDDFRT